MSKLYDSIIYILCFVSVALAIIDFTNGLNSILYLADVIIYLFFVIDYVIRFFLADKKVTFVKSNIFDLIAIIPFNFTNTFRIFRILKISRFLKFTKLLRVISVSARSLSKARRFLNTNGFKYILYLAGASILLSSFAMMYFENMTFYDSLWWAFVTATTVGYGDLSPTTNAGRIIASILMLVGIGLIGSLTSSITTFFLHKDSPEAFNSDKIDMVLTLYKQLSIEEQDVFKEKISDVNE